MSVSVEVVCVVAVAEPVLVPESAQVPALRRAWAPVWVWGRCLGFRLQGAARRQDPSRQWKASGFYPDFSALTTVRDRLIKDV